MLLATCNIVVFTASTTAILFYKMGYDKDLKINKLYLGIFSIFLIIISLLYNLYSLYNFISRSSHIHELAQNSYSKIKIKESQIMNSLITGLVTIFQIGLVYLITKTNLPKIIKLLKL